MKAKCIGYIRVSSKAQDELSPKKQLTMIKEWIENKTYIYGSLSNPELRNLELEFDNRTPELDHENLPKMHGFFFDEISGYDRAQQDKRDGFKAMVRHCKKYKIKHIIFAWISRIERGTVMYEYMLGQFFGTDMEDFYIHAIEKDAPIVCRPLIDRLQGTELKTKIIQAERESAEKSIHTKEGKINSYERGLFAGKPIAGYKAVRTDKGKVAEYIFDSMAPIIKKLFDLAKDKNNPVGFIHEKSIEFGLVHTSGKKKGQPYQKETIRQMLTNKGYIGMVKHPFKEEWKEGTHPALVTVATFERVAENLELRRVKPTADEQEDFKPAFILNLLKCEFCGCKLAMERKEKTLKSGEQTEYRYIRCSNGKYYVEGKHQYYQKKFGSKLCPQPRHSEKGIWKAIDEEVKKLYLNEAMLEYLGEEIDASRESLVADIKRQLVKAESQRVDLDTRKQKVNEAYLNGFYESMEEAKKEKLETVEKLKSVQKRIDILEGNKERILENTKKLLGIFKGFKTKYLALDEVRKVDLLQNMVLGIKIGKNGKNNPTIIWDEPFNVLIKLGSNGQRKQVQHDEVDNFRKEITKVDSSKVEHIERVLGETK